MSELADPSVPRRRADARQNTAAILEAASRVLSTHPEAGLAQIARSAGISRQTLYAHFPSREALVNALVDRATARVLAALDAADLDSGSADQALVRFMEVGWRSFGADSFLLAMAAPPVSAAQDRARHGPILQPLRHVVARGQRDGEIDPHVSSDWIIASVLALGYAAGEEVRAGRMTSHEAVAALRRDIPRLVRR